MIVKVPQFVMQPDGQHRTFNNLFRVHTGCYTKEAFAIINGMVNSEKKDLTFPRVRLRDAIFISDLPSAPSAVWQAMDYKLLLDGVEVPMDGVNIEDDGEITLLISIVLMPYRKDGKYVTERKVCTTLDYYFNNVFIPGTTLKKCTKERLAEMMKLIKKAINGSLTEKDRKSKLFNAAVGMPFNPFEQQIFLHKKEELIKAALNRDFIVADPTTKRLLCRKMAHAYDALIDCLR